jgi:hypothetical protein
VVVHGFDSDMTAGLVGSGLAIAKRETMKAGSRTTDVGQIPPSRRTIADSRSSSDTGKIAVPFTPMRYFELAARGRPAGALVMGSGTRPDLSRIEPAMTRAK